MATLAQQRTFYRDLKNNCIDQRIIDLRLSKRNEPSPGPGEYINSLSRNVIAEKTANSPSKIKKPVALSS